MHPWGKYSICGALSGIILFYWTMTHTFFKIDSGVGLLTTFGLIGASFCAILHFIQIYFSSTPNLGEVCEVLKNSFFLGWTFCIGILLISTDVSMAFGLYVCVMSFFHYSEFLVTAIINAKSLTLESFLLNHSREYGIAAVVSWFEFAIESYFLPGIKTFSIIMWSGFVICFLGEFIRKVAMFTAWQNFTHVVQHSKAKEHELVTNGIYGYCRHPSYVGWFWWSIGTQIMLMNPFCTIAYTLASWRFFNDRIQYEEYNLIRFFGDKYLKYQQDVPTGIPFVKGCCVDE